MFSSKKAVVFTIYINSLPIEIETGAFGLLYLQQLFYETVVPINLLTLSRNIKYPKKLLGKPNDTCSFHLTIERSCAYQAIF